MRELALSRFTLTSPEPSVLEIRSKSTVTSSASPMASAASASSAERRIEMGVSTGLVIKPVSPLRRGKTSTILPGTESGVCRNMLIPLHLPLSKGECAPCVLPDLCHTRETLPFEKGEWPEGSRGINVSEGFSYLSPSATADTNENWCVASTPRTDDERDPNSEAWIPDQVRDRRVERYERISRFAPPSPLVGEGAGVRGYSSPGSVCVALSRQIDSQDRLVLLESPPSPALVRAIDSQDRLHFRTSPTQGRRAFPG